MDLNLGVIRACLLSGFGSKSSVLCIIKKTSPDATTKNLQLHPDGTLTYNQDFLKNNVSTPAHLFGAVMHVFLHDMVKTLLRSEKVAYHLAADAIVNAMITMAFPQQSQNGIFFRDFYRKPTTVEVLLRPDSLPRATSNKLRHLHRFLYGDESESDPYPSYRWHGKPVTTIDVARTIEMLSNIRAPQRGFLGNHDSAENALSKEDMSCLAGAMAEAMFQRGQDAGVSAGGALESIYAEIIETARSIDSKLMARFSDQNKITKFFRLDKADYPNKTLFPKTLTRRDTILLAMGAPPSYFQTTTTTRAMRTENRPQAEVFIDVSGSVAAHMAEILGLLRNS